MSCQFERSREQLNNNKKKRLPQKGQSLLFLSHRAYLGLSCRACRDMFVFDCSRQARTDKVLDVPIAIGTNRK